MRKHLPAGAAAVSVLGLCAAQYGPGGILSPTFGFCHYRSCARRFESWIQRMGISRMETGSVSIMPSESFATSLESGIEDDSIRANSTMRLRASSMWWTTTTCRDASAMRCITTSTSFATCAKRTIATRSAMAGVS